MNAWSFYQVVQLPRSLKANRLAKNVTIFVTTLILANAAWALTAANAQAPCKLAILGDSLTAGYGVEEAQAFPAQLADKLDAEGIACTIINAGVSGDTSAGGAARIGWVLADEPTHLLVELGGNDALRALPVEQMRANLTSIVEKSTAQGVEVMLAGMLAPPNLGAVYGDAFKDVFAQVAAQFDIAFYPFFLEGVAGRKEYLIEDGIHPNPAGVARIVTGIFPHIRDFLTSR